MASAISFSCVVVIPRQPGSFPPCPASITTVFIPKNGDGVILFAPCSPEVGLKVGICEAPSKMIEAIRSMEMRLFKAIGMINSLLLVENPVFQIVPYGTSFVYSCRPDYWDVFR